MARTALTIQAVTRDGLNPTLAAANVDGHSIANDGRTYIEILNSSGSAVMVTQRIPKVVDGVAVANNGKQVSIPAGQRRKIGPWTSDYNQADGTVQIDFSAVTSVTCGAFRVGV